jgi:hypothetical protein
MDINIAVLLASSLMSRALQLKFGRDPVRRS